MRYSRIRIILFAGKKNRVELFVGMDYILSSSAWIENGLCKSMTHWRKLARQGAISARLELCE